MLSVVWRWLSWPLRFLFGRDVFISYARADGDAYVRKLADRLRGAKPRLSYFLDLHVATADPVIPRSVLRHARWCRLFVLLASEAAMREECGTKKELEEFVKRPRRLFVPISVDGAYELRDREAWPWNRVSGATPERATSCAVKDGVVSESVTERIESIAGNSRFEQRLVRATVFALLLVVAGGVFFMRSIIATGDARANRLAAAATSSMTDDYSLALLLAAEALTLRPDLPFPRNAMLDVITRHGGVITLLHPVTPPSNEPLARDVAVVAASPDGTKLASGQATGIVRVWDPRSGMETYPPTSVRGRVLCIAFDRVGRQLLAGTTRGELVVRDLLTGGRKQAQLRTAVIARFRPDGGIAAVSGNDLIDPFTSETLLTIGAETLAFAFSSDGARVMTGGKDGLLRVFDWKTRQLVSAKKISEDSNPPEVWSIVASPTDATVFAASDQDGNVFAFGPGAGQAIRPQLGSEPLLAFSPDGTTLAATISKGIEILRTPDLRLAGRFTYADQPLAVTFIDTRTLASGNRDATIALFSMEALDRFGSACVLESRVSSQLGLLKRACFTSSGDRIAVSDERKKTMVITLRRPPASGEEAVVPYVRRAGYVELQDAISGRRIRSIPLPPKTSAFDAALSGDGCRLAALITRSDDRVLLVYDAATGELLKTWPLDDHLACSIALDMHGKRFAAGDVPGNVVVRSVADGKELAHFFQDDRITAVAFSPDGRTLVAADPGATDIYSLEPALLLGRRGINADCLQFSPDGQTMAVCETDGLRIWQMSSSAWSAAAQRIAGRPLTSNESSEYVGGR